MQLPHQHNVIMTLPASAPQQAPTRVYRMAAMLLGIGSLHFIAPKPFDSIVPAELPGSPRVYTYASGVAEVGIGAALLARLRGARAGRYAADRLRAVVARDHPMVLVSCVTGAGMGEDVLRHVFEPFFTTKAQGTGLGLAIVKRLCHAVGASVDVKSKPGKGSIFRVLLPGAEDLAKTVMNQG